MKKWFTTNIGIKILSFIIAIILWLHLTTERNYESLIKVPVIFEGLGDSLIFIKPPPAYVEIKMTGKGKEFIKFFAKKPKILLNVEEIGLGWNRIEVSKTNIKIPPESKLTPVGNPTPPSFIICIDKKVSKKVKVLPNLSSSYKYKTIPPVVEIFGLSGKISDISYIITEKIESIEANDTIKVKLIPPPEVEVNPCSVSVILFSQ